MLKEKGYTINHKTVLKLMKIGHKAVTDKAVSATCTTLGKTEGRHCSVCNTVIQEQKTIPAKDMAMTQVKLQNNRLLQQLVLKTILAKYVEKQKQKQFLLWV